MSLRYNIELISYAIIMIGLIYNAITFVSIYWKSSEESEEYIRLYVNYFKNSLNETEIQTFEELK
jgi:hypothetical protein